MIVITADHGEPLGEHGLNNHGQALYWHTIHVPLIIWYPEIVPAGMSLPMVVSNASIPATVMDLAGSQPVDPFLLPSLKPLWHDTQRQEASRLVWSEVDLQVHDADDYALAHVIPTSWTGPMKTVVTERWQLITHENLKDQLYDWVRDPKELNNMIATEEGQRVAAGLKAQMEQALKKTQPNK
jgi:arylsulfatase A-like enzyme